MTLLVKNTAAYMVNIPPITHIAPLATGEVDETNRAVALLIKRGVLVDASKPDADAPPSTPSPAVDEEFDEDVPLAGEPTKVADIKAELDSRGITYPDAAKKAELLELLRASQR